MEKIIYRLTLDTHKNGIQKTLQGFETADKIARRIAINLTSGSDTHEITDDVIAVMYVTTPDATEPSVNECSIEGNTIIYDVLPIVEEGITEMQMKLISVGANGAESVLASPKFAVEVTESGTSDSGAEQSITFTALENAIAKANAVYDKRLERVELDDNCIFRVYYADGTVYESDEIREEVHGYVDDSFRSAIESINKSVASAKASEDSAKRSMDNAYLSETFARTSEELAKESEDNAKQSELKAKQYAEQAFSGTPEGYSALVEQVGLLDIAKSTGNTLYNSKKGGYRLNEMVGNTVQNGEPSPSTPIAIENTFDCVEMMNGYWSTSTGAFTSSNTEVCSKRGVSCKPNDIIKIDLETSKFIRVVFYNGNTFISSATSGSTVRVNTYSTTVPSGVDNFKFYIGESTDITPQTVGKITLTINGKYVGQIVEHGKNLLNVIDDTVDGFKITTTKNGYLVNGTSISTNGVVLLNKVLKAGTYVINGMPNGSNSTYQLYITINGSDFGYVTSHTSRKITLTQDSVVKVVLYLYKTLTNVLLPYQLEYGDTLTEYQMPIKEKVTTFFLNEPLRATDRVVKVDGVHMENHKRKKYTITNTSHINKANSNVDDFLYYVSLSDKKAGVVTSDKLIHTTHWNHTGKNLSDLCIDGNASAYPLVVYFNIGYYLAENTVTAVKEWLASNPITIEYELAEETYTPLDTASQLALNDMETFNGTTHIEVDSKIPPTSISGEYGTSQVGAYTLKCMNDNDTDRVERAKLMEMILSLGGNA